MKQSRVVSFERGRKSWLWILTVLALSLVLLGGCGGGSDNGNKNLSPNPSPSPSPSPSLDAEQKFEELSGSHWRGIGSGSVIDKGVKRSVENVPISAEFLFRDEDGDQVLLAISYVDGPSVNEYPQDIKESITQPASNVLVLKIKELSDVDPETGERVRTSGTMTFTFLDDDTDDTYDVVEVVEEGTRFMFDDREDSWVEKLTYTLKRKR